MTADVPAADADETEEQAIPCPLLEEIRELEDDLKNAGLTADLSTWHDVLLIGTAGGGIITAGLSGDRSTWWANGAVGCFAHDLTGDSLTAAVRAEVARHARIATAADHRDALDRDAQRLEGIA